MKSLWKEHDANSKIQLKFNRYGQPCGLKTCKLTNFIGYLVRGKEVSLAAKNWSKVEKTVKEKLWFTIQGFFDINDSYKPWVLRSASKKWKDFKAVLKKKYYNPSLSKRQNIVNGCASRIPKDQWVWLVNHWKSSNAQHKSEKNKAIREQQLNASHTTGSRSYAVVLDQMELKEGRDIGRSELYVATHTKKNGQPVDDFSGEKIEEIKKRFEEDPSLISEEAHDKDLYSTLFPKERSGRRHGLGLLVGGVASTRVFEALADVQEVRHENKRLWSVVEKLMSNQTKLQQQYDELKSQVSAPQRCPSVESSPKINVLPEGHQKVTNKENKDDSVSSPKQEEPKSVILPTLRSTKSRMSQQQKEKDKERAQTLPEKDNKQRKFQTPLHIATKNIEEGIKCGMEVGLTSPNSKMMVALGTIQTTDRKAKAGDGKPLAECVEVLVSIVFNQTTILPRAHGKICKLGNATAHCIPWPRQNIVRSDGSPLDSKVVSAISHMNAKNYAGAGLKTSKLKTEVNNRCYDVSGTSQNAVVKGRSLRLREGHHPSSLKESDNNHTRPKARQACSSKVKGRSSSQFTEGETSNYHISTSRF